MRTFDPSPLKQIYFTVAGDNKNPALLGRPLLRPTSYRMPITGSILTAFYHAVRRTACDYDGKHSCRMRSFSGGHGKAEADSPDSHRRLDSCLVFAKLQAVLCLSRGYQMPVEESHSPRLRPFHHGLLSKCRPRCRLASTWHHPDHPLRMASSTRPKPISAGAPSDVVGCSPSADLGRSHALSLANYVLAV